MNEFNFKIKKASDKFLNPNIQYPVTKKVFLFTNARNEKNMKEWAYHHLLLGFDRVFIFDHKSEPPMIPFDKNVQIIRCDLPNPVKMLLMNEALKISLYLKADWFIYLDADEFLILNNCKNVKELLYKYHHAHSLSLNWLLFGTNHHKKEPEGLILENFTKSEKILNPHVKTFVRPLAVSGSKNPHYYTMKNKNKLLNLQNQLMNPVNLAFNHTHLEYNQVPAYIAHYIYQSEETYINRKINLPRDDNGENRNQEDDIHNKFNDIENNDTKNKYDETIIKNNI